MRWILVYYVATAGAVQWGTPFAFDDELANHRNETAQEIKVRCDAAVKQLEQMPGVHAVCVFVGKEK